LIFFVYKGCVPIEKLLAGIRGQAISWIPTAFLNDSASRDSF